MENITIGVTGVGGGVGQSILKSLYGSNYTLIGMDSELLGTGLYVTQKSYLVPYANDPNFINKILIICKENNIKLLFPGLDAELLILSENSDKFSKIGTTVVVSNQDVIEIAEDKQKTYDILCGLGFNVPVTYKATYTKPSLLFPIIIKPRIGGARSKDVYKVNNNREYDEIIIKLNSKLNDFVVQEYLDGDEYTCGTINLEDKCQGVIVMMRELRNGDTYKCKVIENSLIENTIINLMNKLKPFGACNVQLKLKNGIPYIFELNARCSGTTAARAICGFNEPLIIADFLINNKRPLFKIESKIILRYWKELEVSEREVSELKINKNIETGIKRKL